VSFTLHVSFRYVACQFPLRDGVACRRMREPAGVPHASSRGGARTRMRAVHTGGAARHLRPAQHALQRRVHVLEKAPLRRVVRWRAQLVVQRPRNAVANLRPPASARRGGLRKGGGGAAADFTRGDVKSHVGM